MTQEKYLEAVERQLKAENCPSKQPSRPIVFVGKDNGDGEKTVVYREKV